MKYLLCIITFITYAFVTSLMSNKKPAKETNRQTGLKDYIMVVLDFTFIQSYKLMVFLSV